MFADPQTLSVNSTNTAFAKTKVGQSESTFTNAAETHAFTLKQNQTKGRFRREVRISQQKVAADPISAVNQAVGASVYLVIDEPKFGFSNAELEQLWATLVAFGTSANLNKLLNGEF